MAERQLTLPGLKPRKPERRAGARRDLSERAFRRALDRNGFENVGGLCFADVSGETDLIYTGVVTRAIPVRIARRATLAELIRERQNALRTATQNHSESPEATRAKTTA